MARVGTSPGSLRTHSYPATHSCALAHRSLPAILPARPAPKKPTPNGLSSQSHRHRAPPRLRSPHGTTLIRGHSTPRCTLTPTSHAAVHRISPKCPAPPDPHGNTTANHTYTGIPPRSGKGSPYREPKMTSTQQLLAGIGRESDKAPGSPLQSQRKTHHTRWATSRVFSESFSMTRWIRPR